MKTIELEYASLAEAQAQGPSDLFDLARAEGLRLLDSPVYCEREGCGVLGVTVAAPAPESVPAPVGSTHDNEPTEQD